MLIILEGCDGTGKTTLANQLAETLQSQGRTVVRLARGVPQKHPLEEYEYDLDFYTPGVGVDVVCDRWHWGDAIYGPLYRGKSTLGQPGMDHVGLYLRARGALLAMLDCSVGEVRRRLNERGEDYLRPEHVEHVVNDYRRLFHERQRLECLLMNPSIPRIIQHAEALERQALQIGPLCDYIGSNSPKFLFVGDEASIPRNRPPHAACFVPYPATSGNYLFKSLPERLILRSGFCNSKPFPVKPLWECLGEPAVVALGKLSNERLEAEGVPHGGAPHPQHWRRFHYHDPGSYVELIEDALTKGTRTFS